MTLRKKLLIILVGSFGMLSAQQENHLLDVGLPSPAAYEMTRYDAQQPNLYTGTASVNIPLYTVNLDGMQIPLSLSYHAAGIRTNQEATEVGLGWSLNATAIISRTVNSGDDFSTSSDGTNQIGYIYDYNRDMFNVYENWQNLEEVERIQYQQLMKNQAIDAEPDLFNYNFFGYSGSFMLSKKMNYSDPANPVNPADPVLVRKLNVDATKIVFDELNRTFTITTPEGFVGHFTVKEYTTGLSGSGPFGLPEDLDLYSNVNSSSMIDVLQIVRNGRFRNVTAWYLQKIESPNNGKEMRFEYDLNASANNPNANMNSDYVSIGMPSFSENGLHDYVQRTPYSFSRQVTEHVYLNKLAIFNTELAVNELEVLFQKQARNDIGRLDLGSSVVAQFPQGASNIRPPLRYIGMSINGLLPNSTFNKEITFKQSYFNGDKLIFENNLVKKYQKLRLRLDGVTVDDRIHEFTYYQGANGLPNKSTMGIDHQGFYNGNDDNPYLQPVAMPSPFNGISVFKDWWALPANNSKRYYYFSEERKPSLEYGIAGTLKEVRYPTGGYSSYSYDSPEIYAEGPLNVSNDRTDRYIPPGVPGLPNAEGNLKFGGTRVREIASYDSDNQPISKKSYSYDQKNSTSSAGVLMHPLLHLAYYYGEENSALFHMKAKEPSYSGKNSAQGNSIGYSRALETVWSLDGVNSYSSETYFENNANTIPDFPPLDDVSGPLREFIVKRSLNARNGKVVEQNNLRANGAGTVSSYKVNAFDETITNEIKVGAYNAVQEGASLIITYVPYIIPVGHLQPSETTSTTYFSDGNVLDTDYFTYDDYGQVKSARGLDSKNKNIETITNRLAFYGGACGPQVGGQCMEKWMLDQNMVAQPIERVSYSDGQVISAMGYQYGVEYGNVVLKKIFRYNSSLGAYSPPVDGFTFSGSYEEIVSFDSYNQQGKLLQQTVTNGRTMSYIWDANNNYPIVKGENISYDDLQTAYTSSQGANLQSDLRNHNLTKNAMISSFDADYWMGLKKVTSPSELVQSFEYDEFEKLANIKDLNENLITDYEYNYGGYTKVGGLLADGNLNFGLTEIGTTLSKEVTITNAANYGITISNLTTSNSAFSVNWPFNGYQIYLPPNETFRIPVKFFSAATGDFNATLNITSNDLNGDLSVSLSGQAVPRNPILNIPVNCFVLGNVTPLVDFYTETKYVRIENTGTSPLTFIKLTTDDDHLLFDYRGKLRYDEDGNSYYEPYVIAPNWHLDVEVRLISYKYDTTRDGDWDGTGTINIEGINDDTFIGPAELKFFDVNQPNACPDDPPPAGPAFTFGTGAILEADCNTGMSGNFTVNRGSVIVSNIENLTSTNGNNATGVVIGIFPGTDIAQGGSLVITPPSYPATYTFSSGPVLCTQNDVFGKANIQVIEQ